MDAMQRQNLMGQIYQLLCAEEPDCEAAAQLIDCLLSDPDYRAQPGNGFWLAELSRRYASQQRYAEAIATMERAMQVGLTDQPDGRADIATYLLHLDKGDEAAALFATLQREAPGEVWLYQCAGMAYQSVGQHETALRWLTAGLKLAIQTEDSEALVSQLSQLRRKSLDHLDLTYDKLEEAAEAFVTARQEFATEVVENPWW